MVGGLAVAAVGILYVTLVGWRLMPLHRRGESDEADQFRIEAYITEARVPPDSPLAGEQVRRLEQLCENEVTVMAIARGRRRLLAPAGVETVLKGDILVLEGDPAKRRTEAETAIALIDGLLLLRQLAGPEPANRAARRLGIR